MGDVKWPVAELLFSPSDATPISTDEATLKSWTDVSDRLAAAATYWLATGRPDGRPHVMPVLGVWLQDSMYVATRPQSRKGKNLAQNTDCVISVSTETVNLVVECVASELTDDIDLGHAADAFKAKYDWGLTVRTGHAYEESLPGSPVYGLYRLSPRLAFGFGPDGMTATKWRFNAPATKEIA